MATNDNNAQRGVLSGAAEVPILTFPTLRARVRRNDPDMVRAFPYYPGLTGKSLVAIVRPSPGAAPTATVTANFLSDGYDDAIATINAAGGADLKAYDDGGFLVIQSLHGGGKNTLEVDAAGTGNDILGFDVLALGGFSRAGDIATSSAGGVQANPPGTKLVAHDEQFTSAVVNRAITGSLEGLDQYVSDLDHEITAYRTVFLVHGGGTSFNLGGSSRLAVMALGSGGLDFNYIQIYDLNGDLVYFGDDKVVVSSITYGPPVDPGSHFADWGVPDGKAVANPSFNGSQLKTGPVAITEIRGNLLKAPGAQFITNNVQPHDLITIQGATNDTPFNHNGEFVVVGVPDEDHLYIRPMGAKEEMVDTTEDKPRALNPNLPGGTSYGTVGVYVGFFVPVAMKSGAGNDRMFFNTNVNLVGGNYLIAIPVGASIREMASNPILSPLLTGPSQIRDPDIAYKGKLNTFQHLNTFNEGIRIGDLLSNLAGAQVARTKSIVTDPGTSTYTLVREDTRDFANLTVVRQYTVADADGVRLAITINARWDGVSWNKDLAGVPASLFQFKRDRIIFMYREVDAAWGDGGWALPATIRATAPAFLGEALMPTFIAPAMASASTHFTLVFEAAAGDTPAYKHRIYVRGTDGRLVFTANAVWDGAQWIRDVGGFDSRKLEFSAGQIYLEYRLSASASPWGDGAWDSTNTIWNINSGDPGTLAANNQVRAGDALTLTTALAMVARLRMAMATPGASAKTLMWETSDDSGADDKIRFYMGRGLFEVTVNAVWDNGANEWAKDQAGVHSSKYEFKAGALKYFYRRPANNAAWADGAWDDTGAVIPAAAADLQSGSFGGSFSLGTALLSSDSDARIPRLNFNARSAFGTRTCLWKSGTTGLGGDPNPQIRVYTKVIDDGLGDPVIGFELTINAAWDGAQWVKDVAGNSQVTARLALDPSILLSSTLFSISYELGPGATFNDTWNEGTTGTVIILGGDGVWNADSPFGDTDHSTGVQCMNGGAASKISAGLDFKKEYKTVPTSFTFFAYTETNITALSYTADDVHEWGCLISATTTNASTLSKFHVRVSVS